jgi:hypothetical protein
MVSTHQRYRCGWILGSGYVRMLWPAYKFQLQLQPGKHHGVWYDCRIHSAFRKYGCNGDNQSAQAAARRGWTGIRRIAFVLPGEA